MLRRDRGELNKTKHKNGRNSIGNPAVSIWYDSDWARTSDLYLVKVGDSNPISQTLVFNDKSCDNGRIFINALFY